MRWRRAAVAECATVAALAGVVSVVADAVAADQATPRLAGFTGDGPATAHASSPYRSSPTISVSRPTASCTSSPGAGPAAPSPCVETVEIPRGATEQDVLEKLGEPRRRAPSAGGETWKYSWKLGGDVGLGELFAATLRFDAHRLVESQEYVFK